MIELRKLKSVGPGIDLEVGRVPSAGTVCTYILANVNDPLGIRYEYGYKDSTDKLHAGCTGVHFGRYDFEKASSDMPAISRTMVLARLYDLGHVIELSDDGVWVNKEFSLVPPEKQLAFLNGLAVMAKQLKG